MNKIALLLALIPSVALARPFTPEATTTNNGLRVSVQDLAHRLPDRDGQSSTQFQSLYKVTFPADHPLSKALVAKMVVKIEAKVNGQPKTFDHVVRLVNFHGEFSGNGTGTLATYIDRPASSNLEVTGRKVFIYGEIAATGQEFTNFGSGVPIATPAIP